MQVGLLKFTLKEIRMQGSVYLPSGAVPLQEHGLYLIHLEMGLKKKLKYLVNQKPFHFCTETFMIISCLLMLFIVM